MRIVFGIAEFMVHAMHHTISSWNQVGRTLEKPGAKIKEPFPEFAGRIHLVRRISMQIKSVKEQ